MARPGGETLDSRFARPIPLLGTVVFGTWSIRFTPLCVCLSEETLKAVGSIYLVPMPNEVTHPAQEVNMYPVAHAKPLDPGDNMGDTKSANLLNMSR